jgi:hypothetical protein
MSQNETLSQREEASNKGEYGIARKARSRWPELIAVHIARSRVAAGTAKVS